MGRKQYLEDLKTATSSLNLPNVGRIRKGDADYSVALTYTHPVTDLRLDVSIVPSEVSDYPSEHRFFLWTDSDTVPADASRIIESLSMGSASTTISTMIRNLDSSLTRHLSSDSTGNDSQSSALTDADGDSIMDDLGAQDSDGLDQDDDDDEYDDNGFGDDFDDGFGDDDFGLGSSLRPMTPTLAADGSTSLHTSLGAAAVRRIKVDLKQAHDAGYRVAPVVGLVAESNRSIVSISKRVARLRLSDDTLQAWGISSHDYIVLLIRIIGNYFPFEKAKDSPAADTMKTLEFRVGRCRKHKPSKESAAMAFQTAKQLNAAKSQNEVQGEKDDDFMPIFLSSSLTHFMNHEFVSMLKIRANNHSMSWADASKELEIQRLHLGKATAATGDESYEIPVDHLATANTRKESSLPLIAMELAIHYIVRCTDYCLVCHQKLDSNFEALRPYVCEQPLCLFQYMNLGFGPSIEHEVVDHPYTVDLLLNFCYAGLTCAPVGYHGGQTRQMKARIREFPVGLRLQVPRAFMPSAAETQPGTASNAATPSLSSAPRDTSIQIKFSAHTRQGTMEPGNEGALGVGQWVAILYGRGTRLPTSPVTNEAAQNNVYIGRVSHVLYDKFGLEDVSVGANSQAWKSPIYGYPAQLQQPASGSATGPETLAIEERESLLLPFDQDVDDLEMLEKMAVGRLILNTIPPVMTMRDYLLSHPHRTLSSFKQLSPAAFGLLRWVISSNRSCITLIDDPDAISDTNPPASFSNSQAPQAPQTGPSAVTRRKAPASSVNSQRYRIRGMDQWVQFRFLQGSPEKERRFVTALSDSKNQIDPTYPTIFAWHGSNISNWHSIVRTGLDFQETLNGRAYGNGVYMSADYNTSIGYSANAENPWQNSALKFTTTLALCEVINAPQAYVSTTPHYVVNQIDWIQCRYLFVAGRNPQINQLPRTPAAASYTPETALLPQCPSMICRGQQGPLQIPKAAAVSISSTSPTRGTFERSLVSGYETDPNDEDDIEFLEERLGLPTTPVTDFTPGNLKLDDIITLAPPAYATDSASKAIARELKTMREEMESKPLYELGWYVDLDSVENMFQLIVELHSFDLSLPLAQDMKKAGIDSVVLEMRFGRNFPLSPPFIRVIRPRFLPFQSGGGGHVTIGGAICMELLTNSGWSPACSLETVLVQVRTAICSTDPPARLETVASHRQTYDYGIGEAVDAYERYARTHGWEVPADIKEMVGTGRSY